MTRNQSPSDTGDGLSLIGRLVFSMLRGAVRIAARVEFPLKHLQDLLRTAYFAEYRRRYPRDLQAISDRLGVSLRTAGTLNRRMKDPAYSAENHEEPLRAITRALTGRPMTLSEIEEACNIPAEELDRLIQNLHALGWVERDDEGRQALTGALRVFVDEDQHRRVDAVGHQLEVVADSVWARFVKLNEAGAGARSWSFLARPEDAAASIERLNGMLRAEAVAMEEAALDGRPEDQVRYVMTIAVAPRGEEP